MNKCFTDNGWMDYVYWQTEDRKTLKRINDLLEDIERNDNTGLGKPESLTGNLSGYHQQQRSFDLSTRRREHLHPGLLQSLYKVT